MKRTVFILLFFLLLPLSEAYPLELTLQDSIEMAFENNTGLKVYKTEVISSEEDVNISRADLLPSLKIRGAYQLRDKNDFFVTKANIFAPGIPPADVKQSLENQNFYIAGFVLNQPLFMGGQLVHSLNKSRMLGEETNYRVERQKKLLVFDVKKAFYTALKDQLYRKTFEKIVEAKRERLRVVTELNKEGYVQKDDVLLADSDLAGAELDLFKVRNDEELALSKLKLLIHLNEESEISLKEKPVNGALSASLRQAKETAVANREDLKVAFEQISAAGEDIDIAKSDFYPKTSVQGSYLVQKETTITRSDVWLLTAQLDWSIFDWNKTRSNVRKAESLRQKRQYEYEDLTKTVMIEAEEAWREVKEREKEVEFSEKKLKAAEARYKTAAERYSEKAIKLADLLDMEAGFTKAYDEYIIATNDLNIAFAHLEAATSVKNDGWLTIRELYQSDFACLLAIDKKDAARSEGDSKNTVLADTSDVHVKTPRVCPQISYAIQVCSVRRQQEAERLVKMLAKKIDHARIILQQSGIFYKVRITGFAAKADAVAFSRKLALKKSIIVKSINGH
jgi:outer membrane protein